MSKLSSHYVTINFSNEKNKILPVVYQLFESCLLERWLKLMKAALPITRVENDGHFYGRVFSDEKLLEQKLNQCIDTINEHLISSGNSSKKIELRAKIPMSVEFLNDLHYQFEILEPDTSLQFTPKAFSALLDMNITIHQAEQFAHDTLGSDHVQVLLVPPIKEEFEDEDYKLFDLNYEFGTMYLTYGMTGVPTKDAFIHNTHPTPQHLYSSGMYLCFFEDRNFIEHKELHTWLENRKLDPKDPKLALGYIPLGKIVSPVINDQRAFVKNLAQYRKIVNVSLSQKLTQSVPKTIHPQIENDGLLAPRWPFDSEVMYHLDYRPYIDLKVKFNALELLEEAKKALNYFVVHRDYDQSSEDNIARWRSLGLRSLFGDYTKTQYHTSYKFEGEPIYKKTVFAELCPKTMAFLNTITNVEECERVRFMLLEPGASIKVHRDSQTRDTCLAVNISLNMPKGCVFKAGLNPDGTENKFTSTLPFSDEGSVLLFNNAKYHTVVNNSDTPRIHIIFHGPIRFTDEQLLDLARHQNQIYSRKELLKNLIKKKSLIGEELDKNPYLLNDWLDSGLDHDSIPDNIQLCVWNHNNFHSDEKKKSLDLITMASIFPLNPKVINESQIEDAIKEALNNNKSHIVLIAAGTLFGSLNQAIVSITSFCQKMIENKEVVAGQILDNVDSAVLPYFHEQFVIINLKEWAQLKQPSLGPLFSQHVIKFPPYSRSKEHFHDEYTPHWIASGMELESRQGLANWGTNLMAELISSNKKIVNIPQSIRQHKTYAYPRDNNQIAWDTVKSFIGNRLEGSKNEVFVFNNEKLNIAFYETIKPNTFISVAAGMKPFKIINQYQYTENDSFHFMDFSEKSVSYFKELVQVKNFEDILIVTSEYARPKHGDKSAELCRHHVNSIVRDYFDSDPGKLFSSLKIAAKAKIKVENLIENTDAIPSVLNEKSRFIIWISNAFYNNALYFILTPAEAEEKFLQTVKNICRKTNTKAFRQQNSNTVLFGKTLKEPVGMITDGGVQEKNLIEQDWSQIS